MHTKRIALSLLMAFTCSMIAQEMSPRNRLKYDLIDLKRKSNSAKRIRSIAGCTTFFTFFYSVFSARRRLYDSSDFFGDLCWLNLYWSVPSCVAASLMKIYYDTQLEETKKELERFSPID